MGFKGLTLQLLAFYCYWIIEQRKVETFSHGLWSRGLSHSGRSSSVTSRRTDLMIRFQEKPNKDLNNPYQEQKEPPNPSTNQTASSNDDKSDDISFDFNVIQTWLKTNFSWQNSLFGFISGIILSFSLIFGPIIQSSEYIELFSSPDISLSTSSTTAKESEESIQQPIVLFQSILYNLQRDYIDPINPMTLFKDGMKAMLTSLDPYTEYEDLQEAKQLQESVSGKYAGVGMVIADILPDTGKKGGLTSSSTTTSTTLPGNVQVVSAFEGYAFDKDIRPGDIILSINDIDTRRLNSLQVKDLLRGEPDTTITIRYLRDYSPSSSSFPSSSSTANLENNGKIMETTIKRSSIQLSDIRLATLLGRTEDGIGYINIAGFNLGLGRDFRNAIYLLRTNSINDLKGLIIDLRNNPGGLLDSAVELASYLLPENSEIVTSRGKDGQEIVYRSVSLPIVSKDTKIVVLVNKGSASASEILAGAIQDYDRGLIIGSQSTYGKGLVQKIISLPYNSALKYTIAKYYTPSGRCIQEIQYTGGRATTSSSSTTAPKTKDNSITIVNADSEALDEMREKERLGSFGEGDNSDDDIQLYDAPPAEVLDDIFRFKNNGNTKDNTNDDEGLSLPGKKSRSSKQYPIPEKERKTFYTKLLHRPVKDGKGIEPDLILPNTLLYPSPIETFLYNENLYNEFINAYLPKKYTTSYDQLREQMKAAYQEERTQRNQVIDYYKQLIYNTIMMNAKEISNSPTSSSSSGSSLISRFLPSSYVAQKSLEELDNLHQGYILNNLFNVPSIEQFYVLNHYYDRQLPSDVTTTGLSATTTTTDKKEETGLSKTSKVAKADLIESKAKTPIDAHFFYGDGNSDSDKKLLSSPTSSQGKRGAFITLGNKDLRTHEQFRQLLFTDFEDFLKQKVQSTSLPAVSNQQKQQQQLQYSNLLKKEFQSFKNLFYYFPSLSKMINEEVDNNIIPKINDFMIKDLYRQREEIVNTLETVLLNKELPNRLLSYYQLQHDPELSVAMKLLTPSSSSSSQSVSVSTDSESTVPVQVIKKNGMSYYKVLPEVLKKKFNENNLNQKKTIEKESVTYDSLLSLREK